MDVPIDGAALSGSCSRKPAVAAYSLGISSIVRQITSPRRTVRSAGFMDADVDFAAHRLGGWSRIVCKGRPPRPPLHCRRVPLILQAHQVVRRGDWAAPVLA